jgi:hypothetical protein
MNEVKHRSRQIRILTENNDEIRREHSRVGLHDYFSQNPL